MAPEMKDRKETSPHASTAISAPARVSIIIPVLNSRMTLERCIGPLLDAVGRIPTIELIALDHSSTDGSYEWLVEHCSRAAKVIQIAGGTIASLRNHGARLASGELLCFIDSDCVIAPGYFERVVDVFRRIDPDATGSKYDLPPDPHWIEETWHNLHHRSGDGYVDYLNSGNLIVKKSAFDQVGGFDEKLETDEDADLGFRLRGAGFKIYESHKISAVHLGNPKSLGAFFRKESWHGMGMFTLRKQSISDKVLMLSILHGLLLSLASVAFFIPRLPLAARLAVALSSLSFVSALAVTYRFVKLGKVYRPLRSQLLYWCFFTAKVGALCRTIAGRGRGRAGQRRDRSHEPSKLARS